MYIGYNDTIHFTKELYDKILIREADSEGFWYHHGESPETHEFFLAAIKRAAQMQKDGSYKDFDPYALNNSELDEKAYYMFFDKGERIILSWNEENERFEVVNGRHRLRMMQLNNVEMDLEVKYGFSFKLMNKETEIKKDEQIDVDKNTFFDLFKKIRHIFNNKLENIPEQTKQNSKRFAIAIDIEDLTDDILQKLNMDKNEIFTSTYSSEYKNEKGTFSNGEYAIFDERKHNLDEIIEKLQENNINIYEAIVEKEER